MPKRLFNLPPELNDRLEAYRARRGLKFSRTALCELLERGLREPAAPAAALKVTGAKAERSTAFKSRLKGEWKAP